MLAVGVAFLVAVIIAGIIRGAHSERPAAAKSAPSVAGQAAVKSTPGAARFLGLLLLMAALLLLAWVYVPKPQQFLLMANLIYPATVGVALMLLFDKATRAWNVKSPAENAREWLVCDGIVFLAVLGYLNLVLANPGQKYNVFFWDLLYLTLFFFVFWLLDRKTTRYRFLVANGYLVLVPILLLIWRTVLEIPAPAEFAFWHSIWPFFAWAVIAFVLEIIVLLATRDTDHPIAGLIKDIMFLAVYGLLLIIAAL